jgi:hypothetical protein
VELQKVESQKHIARGALAWYEVYKELEGAIANICAMSFHYLLAHARHQLKA